MPHPLTSLHGTKKLQYIWDYYKLPIAGILLVLFVLGSFLHRSATKKETVLSLAFVNVNMSDELTSELTNSFLLAQDLSLKANQLELARGLYLTTDTSSEYHEYTYASRMKILAAINSQQLDLVWMNREAFDAFAQNGYLMDLPEFLSEDSALSELLSPHLVQNTVILEDNATDLILDDTLEYTSVTEESVCGLNLSASPFIAESGFQDPVYLGVIRNTKHPETVRKYLSYLYSGN